MCADIPAGAELGDNAGCSNHECGFSQSFVSPLFTTYFSVALLRKTIHDEV